MRIDKLLNSRADTVEQRVGKWALRQFVLLPLVFLIGAGAPSRWCQCSAVTDVGRRPYRAEAMGQ
jgi:hypothetical protein